MKIYQNLWAGYKSYFVKTTQNKKYAYGYSLVQINGKWRLKRGSYYTHDLKYDTEHFPIVGNINLNEIIINAILYAIYEASVWGDKATSDFDILKKTFLIPDENRRINGNDD